jgi:hypothetical protein
MDRDRVLTKLRLSLGQNRTLGERRDSRSIGQIRPPKEDTGARDGRTEGQPALGAKMKSDPLERYGPTDGATIHPANIAKLNRSRDL